MGSRSKAFTILCGSEGGLFTLVLCRDSAMSSSSRGSMCQHRVNPGQVSYVGVSRADTRTNMNTQETYHSDLQKRQYDKHATHVERHRYGAASDCTIAQNNKTPACTDIVQSPRDTAGSTTETRTDTTLRPSTRSLW